MVKDPFRVCGDDEQAFLVLCEVHLPDGNIHKTNTRSKLFGTLLNYNTTSAWVGFEQEYTFFKDGRPLGWPEGGYPPPQGPFYVESAQMKFMEEKLLKIIYLNVTLQVYLFVV